MRSVRGFVHRFVRGFMEDGLDDIAAMMTYYAIFAVFPMMVFVLSVTLLIVPGDVIGEGVIMAQRVLPPEVGRILAEEVARTQRATEPYVAIVAGGIALFGASRGTSALIGALNRVFGLRETRPWWRRQVLAISVTLLIASMIVVALSLLLIGPILGPWVERHHQLGSAVELSWSVGRWLGAAAMMTLVWATLYKLLPNHDLPWRTFAPGAAIGVILWVSVSQAAAYVMSHLTDYEATYGAFAGALALLFWMWLSNLALVIGAELSQVASE
ncbi:MAG TPA: YihY/virulence factor BrkB family protein [Kofleriaceae bacterium]|nr:YihY/virulence factor BrkB family protein [Kofleriaceae bacterium]